MLVKRVYEGEWEIYHNEKVVGNIHTHDGFRRNIKTLYVGEKRIEEIRNQKEAVEKLRSFFEENKKKIKLKEELIEQLSSGIAQVKYQVCKNVLSKEKEKLSKELKELKSYDLI